jgi:hypothetical protein
MLPQMDNAVAKTFEKILLNKEVSINSLRREDKLDF